MLSHNTTDGCNLIFAGTPWQAGDRIVTTSFEHPALNGLIAWARDTFGVEVVIVDIPSNFTAEITVDDVLDWFEPALAVPLTGGKQDIRGADDAAGLDGIGDRGTPRTLAGIAAEVDAGRRRRGSGTAESTPEARRWQRR